MTWLIGSKIIKFKKKISSAPLENFKKDKENSLTGFSLIELLVVVVIIGSLLSLSLPRFRGTFNNLQFDNFCQNLINRMKYLQENASVEQSIYRLNFDLNNKIINIEVKEETSEEFADAKGILVRKITIPQGIEIETSESNILFYPDGSIVGKDIEISGYQNKATIYIRESIGRIELQRNYE